MKRVTLKTIVFASILCALLLTPQLAFGQGPVELNVWIHSAQWENPQWQLPEFVDWFNETHPDIHVKVNQMTSIDEVVTAFASGLPMDVVQLRYQWVPVLGRSGAVVPLDSYLERDPVVNADFVPKAFSERGRYRSHIVALTEFPTWRFMIANRSHFDDSGISLPPLRASDTWSMDEFVDDVSRMRRTGANGDVTRWGFAISSTSIDRADNWARLYGGKVYDVDKNRMTLDSEQSLDALYSLRNMIDQKLIPGPDDSAGPNLSSYNAQQVSVYYGPSQHLFSVDEALSKDTTVLPVPRGPAGTAGINHGTYFAISGSSAKKDAAWEFIRSRFLDIAGLRDAKSIPPQFPWAALFASSEGWDFHDDMIALANGWMGEAVQPFVPYPGLDEIDPILGKALGQFMRREAGDEVIREAVRQANAILQRYDN